MALDGQWRHGAEISCGRPDDSSSSIHYYKKMMQGGENRISFNIFDEALQIYADKFYAFAVPVLSSELHRGNGHRVRFNSDPKYPQFVERIEAVHPKPPSKRRHP